MDFINVLAAMALEPLRVSRGTYTRDIITIADALGEQAIADFPSED